MFIPIKTIFKDMITVCGEHDLFISCNWKAYNSSHDCIDL